MKKLTNGVIRFFSYGFYGVGYATPSAWKADNKPLWAWFFSLEKWRTHRQLAVLGLILAVPA